MVMIFLMKKLQWNEILGAARNGKVSCAGRFTGIGDHRPRHGLFEIVEWEVVK